MRPVQTLLAGTGWLLLGCGKHAAPPPPAAHLEPVAPMASAVRPRPPRVTTRDRVTLDGGFHAPSARDDRGDTPRVFAKAIRAWIQSRPTPSSDRLGYLRAGSSSPATGPAGTEGCAGGWYGVEPEGFVCVGPTATLDAREPAVVLSQLGSAEVGRKLPYIYGTVRNPGPVYTRLPTGTELHDAEPDLAERMPAWLSAPGEIGASYAQDVWLGAPGTLPDPSEAWASHQSDPIPELLRRGAGARLTETGNASDSELVLGKMKPKVGYSLLSTFLFEGRRYGLASDLSVIPTDRLRPIRGSEFHGVEIGTAVKLPFAFVRRDGARFMRFEKKKNQLEDAGPAPYRAAIALTGKRKFFRGRLHDETADGLYLSDQDASRIDPARRMPAWGKNGERWLDVNLSKQTLVAYDGERPIFATLVSSGEAGLDDADTTTATKRGIFRIHTKHLSSTMSSDEVGEEYELRDVPYVQYFEKGYALHGAYWHDRFGTPKSHGCINLSPDDARRLFFFTEPALPDGWHGVLAPRTGTVVFIHP
ncbi:MAG TPA: L,D-transpeptidase [Polyangiaceae bacterium]|nr:L,D-transpeptidase [Polyangiaceae bacterium]